MAALAQVEKYVDMLIKELHKKDLVIQENEMTIKNLESDSQRLRKRLGDQVDCQCSTVVTTVNVQTESPQKKTKSVFDDRRASQAFADQLKLNLPSDCVLINHQETLEMETFTLESRQQFNSYLDSIIGDMMKVSGNFFAAIQTIKIIIKEELEALAICCLRVVHNLHHDYDRFKSEIVRCLKSIRKQIQSLTMSHGNKQSMATTIMNMIYVFSKHHSIPALKRKPKDRSLQVIPLWTTLPSQVFVNNLEQFELPPEDCVHEDLLIQFPSETREMFTSYFENLVEKVLNEAGDFFEWINLPAIKFIIEDEVKKMKILVLRVTNHNHLSFRVFKDDFDGCLSRMRTLVTSSRSLEQSRDTVQTIIKLMAKASTMKQIIRGCKGNGIPILQKPRKRDQ